MLLKKLITQKTYLNLINPSNKILEFSNDEGFYKMILK